MWSARCSEPDTPLRQAIDRPGRLVESCGQQAQRRFHRSLPGVLDQRDWPGFHTTARARATRATRSCRVGRPSRQRPDRQDSSQQGSGRGRPLMSSHGQSGPVRPKPRDSERSRRRRRPRGLDSESKLWPPIGNAIRGSTGNKRVVTTSASAAAATTPKTASLRFLDTGPLSVEGCTNSTRGDCPTPALRGIR